MKLKVDCTFESMRLARDQEYKLTYVAPLVELSNALSILRGLNRRFMIAMIVNGNKTKFDDVGLYKIAIDKDGETKFTLSVPYEQLDQTDLAYFGRCQQSNISLYCKMDNGNGGEEADNEQGD